jgi:hypothetical protein
VTLAGLAEVSRIWPVKDRTVFDPLEDVHCWTAEQLDMRFNYKPENPLHLMALRVYRLKEPRTLANTAAYGGCKSWVPLGPGHAVDDAGAKAVMDDGAFAKVVGRVQEVLTSRARE